MEIGKSKREGIFSKFKGYGQGQVQGVVDTHRSWSDFETEPLVKGPILNSRGGSTTVKSELTIPVSRRMEDVTRVTKLLLEPGGIQWVAHSTELEYIREKMRKKYLEDKNVEDTDSSTSFWKKVSKSAVGFLKDVGSSLLDTAGLTASVLAQVAVAGTGEHQTPFISRAYLKKGGQEKEDGKFKKLLKAVGTAVGLTDGDYINGASYAMEGTIVPISRKDIAYSYINIYGTSKAELLAGPSPGFTRLSYSGRTPMESAKWSRGSKAPLPVYGDYNEFDTSEYKGYYETVVQGTETTGSLPWTWDQTVDEPHITHGLGNVFHSSTVKQGLRTEKSEFVDRGGTLNKRFGLDTQFYSSSKPETTYEGWIKKQSPEVPYEVGDRIRGIVSGEEEVIVGRGKHLIKLREKPSNSESFTVQDTAASAQWVSDPAHDIEFFRKVGLIPFEISSITPEKRYYMAFEANLDSINDSYSGNWTGEQYVGRAEKFYVYTGFDRQIDFSFKVVASHYKYLQSLYQKLNKLAATTAPTYKSDGTFMRGTLTSVTIGDYFVDLKGFFKSIKLSWKTDYLWEIKESKEYLRVPLLLDVSVSFTPIHDFIPDSIGDGTLKYFGEASKLTKTAETKRTVEVEVE